VVTPGVCEYWALLAHQIWTKNVAKMKMDSVTLFKVD
jgi:hypothetical protein